MVSQVARPQPVASTLATVAAIADDMMQAAGSLMSLESAATAFEPLAAPSAPGATVLAPSATAAPTVAPTLSVLQGSDSGMNLFIAAAIVGPCAALRPTGHTPGGW